MSATHQRIFRRPSSRVVDSSALFAEMPTEMPTEMVEGARRRLRVFRFLTAAVFAFYLVLYLTVLKEHALALAWFLRRCGSGRSIAAPGVGFEILLCLELAISQYWLPIAHIKPVDMVSWNAVIIAMYPMLVPAPLRWSLFGSLTSAAMTPLIIVVSVIWRGDAWPDFGIALSLVVPQFICAWMGHTGAQVVNSLGTSVARMRRLGRYELVEKLGEGGMGEVWRARHRLLARPAAIKR